MQINRSVILILLAMFGFGLMAFFTREANAPIVTIATWRAVLVAVVFGIWAMLTEGGERLIRPSKEQLRIGVPYGLFLALASSTFVGGYALTTVANTIFFHNLAPIIAFPLAVKLLKEKTDNSAVAGSIIALSGIALISGISAFHASHFSNPRFLLGDFLAVVSAFGYAGVLIWTKKTRIAELPIISTLFIAWGVGAIGLIVIAAFLGQLAISWEALAWTLGLAIFCTNIPFYLLNKGMKDVSAGLSALLSMSEVLFATLVGILFYSEGMAPAGWLGGGLVAIGVLYPFFANSSETTPLNEKSPEQQQTRNIRAFFWLVALNAAAAGLIFGMGSALAWISIAALLRLGADPLHSLLDGRFNRLQRVVFGVIGGLILIGLLLLGGGKPQLNLIVVPLALALLWIDEWFFKQEGKGGDQLHLLPHITLALIATQVFGLMEHGAALIFHFLTLGGVALMGLEVIQRSVRGEHQLESIDDRIAKSLSPLKWTFLLIVGFAVGGFHQVPTGHEGIVERLGTPQEETLSPGLHLRFPPPIDEITIVDTLGIRRVQFSDLQTPLLCGDQSMLTVKASLHYRVKSPLLYEYEVKDIDSLLEAEARAALVRTLRNSPQEKMLTNGKEALALQLKSQIQITLDSVSHNNQSLINAGVHLQSVQIHTITVPLSVQDAFLDVISATEEKTAIINKAEAYAASAVPIALGEAAATHQRAEAQVLQLQSAAAVRSSHFNAHLQGSGSQLSLTMDRLYMEGIMRSLRNPYVITDDVQLWLHSLPPVEEKP
jgi:drug/metabolite transporter (DMT)-like permease/regulator of protease activity HflC (stomatin/prohibitin superfamily)